LIQFGDFGLCSQIPAGAWRRRQKVSSGRAIAVRPIAVIALTTASVSARWSGS
jgi:hypothetical protein